VVSARALLAPVRQQLGAASRAAAKRDAGSSIGILGSSQRHGAKIVLVAVSKIRTVDPSQSHEKKKAGFASLLKKGISNLAPEFNRLFLLLQL
jgi:hypothetical protein